MRKTAWVLTSLMVVSAAAAMAAEAPATDMSKDKGTMAAPADKGMDKGMAKHKAKSGSVKGDVTAVDATAKTITVKDTTATWDDKTTITPKGKTSADIKVGDNVTVWYKADGDTKTVTKIAIHPVKAAGKMSKKSS